MQKDSAFKRERLAGTQIDRAFQRDCKWHGAVRAEEMPKNLAFNPGSIGQHPDY
jgi:hypothetical protein